MLEEPSQAAEDETQTSQILGQLTATKRSTGLSAAAHDTSAAPLRARHPSDKSMSNGSSSAVSQNPPPMHFYGLAATQTQTQSRSDESGEHGEHSGSQKENTPLEQDAIGKPSSPPPITPASPLGTSAARLAPLSQPQAFGDAARPGQGASGSLTTTSPHTRKKVGFNDAHIVSAQRGSPGGDGIKGIARARTYPPSAETTRSRRPNSPASQDSFAADVLVEEPDRVFLASSQFDRTPSQLQRDSQTTSTSGTAHLHAPRSAAPPAPRLRTGHEANQSTGMTSTSQESDRSKSQAKSHYPPEDDEDAMFSENAQPRSPSPSQSQLPYPSSLEPFSQQVQPLPQGPQPSTRAVMDFNPSPPSPVQTQTQLDQFTDDEEPTQQILGPLPEDDGDAATQPVQTQATQATSEPPTAPAEILRPGGGLANFYPDRMRRITAHADDPPARIVPQAVRLPRRDTFPDASVPETSVTGAADFTLTRPTADSQLRGPARAIAPMAPPPVPAIASKLGKKRPREETVEAAIASVYAAQNAGTAEESRPSPPRPPPAKRVRTELEDEDVIPDSEPPEVDDGAIPSSAPEQDAKPTARRPSPLQSRRPPSVKVAHPPIDIVPETVDMGRDDEHESSQDEPPLALQLDQNISIPTPQSVASTVRPPAKNPRTTRARGRTVSAEKEVSGRGTPRSRLAVTKGKKRMLSEREESGTPTTSHSGVDDDLEATPDREATEPLEDTMDVDALPRPKATVTRASARSTARKAPVKVERKSSAKPKPRLAPLDAVAGASFASTAANLTAQGDQLPVLSTRKPIPAAARVFAYWKDMQAYYSGTVMTYDRELQRYTIDFDDGLESLLPLESLRRCELRKGDIVLLPSATGASKVSGEVLEVHGNRGDSLVRITVKKKRTIKEEVVDAELKVVRVHNKTITASWGDRVLQAHEVEAMQNDNDCVASPSLRRSPSKRHTSMHAGTACGDMWAGYGFVTTGVSAEMQDAIQADEGIIVEEGWTAIYALHGQTRANGVWMARHEQLRYSFNKDMQRVFLLAEQPSQTPKYLMALALGIPCVSTEWITQSQREGEVLSWKPYLLDAGKCEYMGDPEGTVAQVVHSRWGDEPHHMRDLCFASSVFREKSILVVNSKWVPTAKYSTDHREIPRIVLAMGAGSVEAVGDSRAKPSQAYTSYDYIIVDKCPVWLGKMKDIHVLPWSWVKDCLIVNRLLPEPRDEHVSETAVSSEEDD